MDHAALAIPARQALLELPFLAVHSVTLAAARQTSLPGCSTINELELGFEVPQPALLVARAGKCFDALSAPEQYRARKRLKRLRYLAKFVQSMWGGKSVRRYLKRLRLAQDALGYLRASIKVTARTAHGALKQAARAALLASLKYVGRMSHTWCLGGQYPHVAKHGSIVLSIDRHL